MTVALASFRAAPLDRTARVVTRLVWGLGAVFVLVGIVLLGTSSSLVGVALIVTGVLGTGMAWWLRSREPVAFVVADDGLVVERRAAAARRFVGGVSAVQPSKLGLRVAGDGGVYGYLGKYRAEGRTVEAFVTDQRRVVVLEVGDRHVAVSPADVDGFVAACGSDDA